MHCVVLTSSWHEMPVINISLPFLCSSASSIAPILRAPQQWPSIAIMRLRGDCAPALAAPPTALRRSQRWRTDVRASKGRDRARRRVDLPVRPLQRGQPPPPLAIPATAPHRHLCHSHPMGVTPTAASASDGLLLLQAARAPSGLATQWRPLTLAVPLLAFHRLRRRSSPGQRAEA